MLSKLAKEVAKKENAVAEDRKRLDDDFEDVGVWVQTKSSELLNADQHLEPLKAFAIEKKVADQNTDKKITFKASRWLAEILKAVKIAQQI